MKKNLVFAGLGSLVVISGSVVGGWAIVQSVESNNQILSNAKQIIPAMSNFQMYNYSSEYVAKYAENNDYEFSTIEGYDNRIEYQVINQKPDIKNLKLNLEIKINVKGNTLNEKTYDVELPQSFATNEESSKYIIQETINDFSKFNKVTLNNPPQPGITISPANLILNPEKYTKKIDESTSEVYFIFNKNGAKISALRTISLDSNLDEWTDFKTEYEKLFSPEDLDFKALSENINNKKTVMLFSVNDIFTNASKIDNSKGVIVSKDFNYLDPSNNIENALEAPVTINAISMPTAQQIINSIKDGSQTKYLKFFGDNPSKEDQLAFNKFNYNIVSGTIGENDLIQTTLKLEIIISDKKDSNITKTYNFELTNLLSVQQNQFNEFGDAIKLKPIITNSGTIDEIIENWNSSLGFEKSELDKYQGFDFEIINAIKTLATNNTYSITVTVTITNSINSTSFTPETYDIVIFNGWN